MATFIAVLAGLMLGSFLSVLLERWEHKEGIVAGRSRCPACRRTLAWFDLLPLVSWLLLRGSCRYCAARVSPLYPALEAAMGTVLGLYVWRFGVPTLWTFTDLVLLFGLVCLFFFDLKWRLLPDAFTFGIAAIAAARLAGLRPDLLVNGLATGALLAAAFLLLYLATGRRGVGLGDVKLALAIGILFGFPMAVGVTLAAVWGGALVGVGLMIAGRANRKTALPFGSFWAAAAIAAIIFPGQLAWLSGLVLPFSL